MPDVNTVQLTGTIGASGPMMMTTTDGDREAHFTLIRETFNIAVVTSSQHGLWVASTMSAGDTVQVEGQLRQDGAGYFIQAERIDMVRKHATEDHR
jgi:hypothetical protein